MVDLAIKKYIIVGIIILLFISFGGYAIYYYSSDIEKEWASYNCQKKGSPDYPPCSTIKYQKMKKELDKLAVLGEGENCTNNNYKDLESRINSKVQSCKPGYRCIDRDAISSRGVCVKENKTSDYDTR